MKRKIRHLVGSTLLCSILAINMLATPNISFAAQKSVPKDMEILGNTTNKYDLNGDDKIDVIKKKITKNGANNILKLYINNKLCLTLKSKYEICVEVGDLDKNDNYLDFYIHEIYDEMYTDKSFFVRYNGESLDSKVEFNPQIPNIVSANYTITKLDGNGKFYIRNNNSNCDAIGMFACSVPYQLKDGSITVASKTYKIDKQYSLVDKYDAAKSFPAYAKAGSEKVAYTVKKGNKVTFDTVYISKSGKTYLKMIDNKGRIGWIKSDQKNLFSNAN